MDLNYIKNEDAIAFLTKIEDSAVDLVFTSPPYNRLRNDKYAEYDDTIPNYFEFLCNIIDESMRIAEKMVILNIQKTFYNKIDVFNLIGKYSDKIQDIFIWEKSNPMPAAGYAITNAYEFFIFFSDKPIKAKNTYVKNILTTSVNSNMPDDHSAVMKYEVAEHFILNFTDDGDIVCDPFMGYGTTAIACYNNNRKYIGCDITKIYVDKANKRLDDIKKVNTTWF